MSIKEFVLYLLGYTCLINIRSKEIHDLENEHKNCKISLIANKKFITRKKAKKLLSSDEYDGCRWCNKEHNNG